MRREAAARPPLPEATVWVLDAPGGRSALPIRGLDFQQAYLLKHPKALATLNILPDDPRSPNILSLIFSQSKATSMPQQDRAQRVQERWRARTLRPVQHWSTDVEASHGIATNDAFTRLSGFKPAKQPRYEARIASNVSTRAEAYALRYESYRAYDHIEANASRSFSDKFDLLPNATTIVVYKDEVPAGSVRVCSLRRGPGTSSPGREAFPDEVDALLSASGPKRAGIDGVEVNRLVRSPAAANDQALVFMLLRLAGQLALNMDFRAALLCVRQNHIPFYTRIGFREAGSPRVYPGLTCRMTLLVSTRPDYDEMRQRFSLLNPEAGAPGALNGLSDGHTVQPNLVSRR